MNTTKQKLLDSALLIFNEKGFQSTRVSDIVKHSGVAQGTFYLYFKSKEDVFIVLANHFIEKMLNELDCISEQLDQIDKLTLIHQMVYHALQLLYKNKPFLKLLTEHRHETMLIEETCLKHEAEMREYISRNLCSFQPYSSFQENQLEIAVYGIQSMIHSISYEWFIVKNVESSYINKLSEVIMRLILK